MPGCSILKFPNCVDIASMAYQEPTLDNEPQLIYVGHILPSKGLRELMEACNRFPDDLKWRLKIIGPGSNIAFKEELQDKLTHKTRKRVEFLGELSHGMTMQLLSQSDILVLPSYSEGFPNVILEAMAAGKAILATEVGAIPEMIQGEKGACGLCVPPREVGPLAESLELLLRDKQLRVSMGRAGRLHAEKSFALPVVFSRLKGLWNLGGQKNYVQE
jgi:glycosyltransferase involved in cell wall biosynthesis